MAMRAEEIKQMILKDIPDAEIELIDTVGDGDHYKAIISSHTFKGLSRIQQHQLIYRALGEKMGDQLHALSIKTVIPNKG